MNGLYYSKFDSYHASMKFETTISIKPIAKQSVRHKAIIGKDGVLKNISYQNRDKNNYIETLRWKLIQARPKSMSVSTKPIMLKVIFGFASKTNKDGALKITKPDIDNLCKPLFDAMNGTVIFDDSQIVLLQAIKKYSKKDYIYLSIQELENES